MRHHICALVALVGVCVCSPLLRAETDGSQGQPIEISTVTNTANQSSTEMIEAFREKIGSHPSLFSLVSNLDESTGLVFDADCMTRDKLSDAYVCFYTSYYAGGVIRTPLGSGMYASKSADDVANNLLASMAQDVAERWNSTIRNNGEQGPVIEVADSPSWFSSQQLAFGVTLVQVANPETNAKKAEPLLS